MITPNPFFPQFNNIKNYNNIYNTNKSIHQTSYPPKPNMGGYKKSTYANNNNKNDFVSNCSTFSGNFSDTFNMENQKKEEKQDKPIFEIFGIKLYFDDLLIIAILFFLYKEECTDDSLFIILILLLLS